MKLKLLIILTLLICLNFFSQAQTFNGGGGAIPDNGPAVYFPINVSGLSYNIIDSTFGVESVCIDIIHTNDYQLTIQLVAPDGTTIDLSMNNGGTGNNYTNTCFNATAAVNITAGNPPFTGSYLPQGILGNVNNSQNGNGIWQLKVQDNNYGSTGSVNSWSITFSNTPALPLVFSSDLPLVILDTYGQTIVDDPKKIVHMGIIDNGFGVRNYETDSFNTYNSNIAIEIRGSWSQTFPQKQYGFETLNAQNIETDTIVMGMPAQSDWILNAPYNDKTCMRNVLAYDIANKTNHYASRTRFCELIINGNYKGIYVMMEKVKRDSNRVDISKLLPTDTAGDELTGGYIVKIDKTTGSGGTGWDSNYDGIPGTPIHFQYEYPSDVNIVPKQANYIQAYVDSFENALNATWFTNPDSGYKSFIDVQSFVDYFILNEACKNVDAYRNSTFLYKKKITKGGKLFVGPAWDYNIAFWNADYCQGYLTTGWQYQFNNICGTQGDNNVPFWWSKMLQDPEFTSLLRCRWNQLRQSVLNTNTLMNYIDSLALVLNEAKDRHFIQWPILGVAVWANPQPVATTYAGEISNMKTWLHQRLIWLDANMPGICNPLGGDELLATTPTQTQFMIYPNPSSNSITINSSHHFTKNATVIINDGIGKQVLNRSFVTGINGDVFQINIATLSPGVYFLNVFDNNVSIGVKKLIKL